MARADLLIDIVAAARGGDSELLERAVHALAAEERANQHQVLADRLEGALRRNGTPNAGPELASDPNGLFSIRSPRRRLNEMVLPPAVRRICGEFIEEHHRAELLRSHGLEPRNRVLLIGPPGNGKTTLAEAIAEALVVPMVMLRYDSIIGSYLGETARQLGAVFAFVRSRRCVLFIDEFDAIAKERGDVHETGEIKRVVSSLLLLIDDVPSHVVVVAASNHPELLDRASWRRFQVQLQLPQPTRTAVGEWLGLFQTRMTPGFRMPHTLLAERLAGASFAEIEEFAMSALRRWILDGPDADSLKIARRLLADWQRRPRVGSR